MTSIRISLNGDGIRSLLHDPEVTAHLRGRMERVLETARSTAPVSTPSENPDHTPGAYRDSMSITEHSTATRTVVRVISTSDHAMDVEARHGTLARALDSAGGA